MRKSEGITLVALVVTIIVLLILAGVTLSLVAGENGILKRATTAVDINEIATAEEQADLLVAEFVTQYYEEKYVNHADVKTLDEYLKEQLKNVKETATGEYTVICNENGKVQVFKNGNEISWGTLVNGKVNWSGASGSNDQPMYEDYTDNLLYKADFNQLLKGENGVTITGSGITVDPTNTYATFDGTSGITVPAEQVDKESKLVGSSSKTIALWYRNNEYKEESVPIVIGQVGTYNANVCAFVFRNGNLACDLGSGVYDCTAAIRPENFCDGRWHFIVEVCEGGNMVKGYYDTVEFSKQVNYNTANSKVSIGSNYGSAYYRGDLADIRIYSSALNEDQIYQLYEYGKELLKDK